MRKILLLLIACTCFIIANAQLTVTTIQGQQVSCYGGSNATDTTHATAGVLPYSYTLYITGQTPVDSVQLPITDSIATGLRKGNYVVLVVDAVNDSVYSNFFIDEPSEISAENFPTDVTCHGGSDGAVFVAPFGGTVAFGSDYTYQWTTGQNTGSISNLTAGTYEVLITDDNGCTLNVTDLVIAEPDTLTIDADLTFGCVFNQSLFQHQRLVNINVTANGGTQPYAYLWSGSNGFNAVTEDISNPDNAAGTYKVVVSYNGVCKDSVSIDVATYTPISVNYIAQNPTCFASNNGSVQINISGGTAPFQMLWNGVPTNNFNQVGLAGTTYTITNLQDSIGCLGNFGVSQYLPVIEVPLMAPALLTATYTTVDVACNDSSTGSINLTVQGGTPYMATGVPVYLYNWNSGQFSTQDLNNLHAGSYAVVVTDSLGCTVSVNTSIINLRPPIISPNTHVNLACNGVDTGWIKLHVSGGEPLYQYNWTGPQATIAGQGTDSIYNLQAGMYYVTVNDEFGCQKFDSVLITQPLPLTVTTVSTIVTCAGGSDGTAGVTVSGGVPGYQYLWAGPNSFSATTPAISSVPAGPYYVYIKDSNGCNDAGTAVTILSNTAIQIGGLALDPSCSGNCDGKVLLGLTGAVSGGVPGYNYLWSTGSTLDSIVGLCTGNYDVTVTDSKGCNSTKTFTLADPLPVSISLGPDRTLCDTQNLRLNIRIPEPANYAWTGPNNFTRSTDTATLYTTGTYYAVATTTPNGCIGRDTINISRSTAPISSNFLVSTQAFKGRTVTIVNTSNPMPGTVQWIVPPSPNITTQSSTDRILELVFSDTGHYVIGLRSVSGPCEETSAQDVIVVQPEPLDSIATVDPLIREFNVYPNPLVMPFHVLVKLKDKSKIRLRLYNVITSALIDDRRYGYNNNAEDYYEPAYNLSLAAGVYVFLLETPNASMVYKVVKE